jgi:tetratricopeptide (TPR) repeat protein
VFKKKYLLLELDPFEAEFYHLPELVPYFEHEQKKLEQLGFNWDITVDAMRALVKEENCEEYKLFKLFIRKWEHYQRLTQSLEKQDYKDAQKAIDKILAIDLLDPSAYFNLAYVFRMQGEYLRSEQAYHKGLELVTYKAPFYLGLAKNYEAIGKFEDAIYFWNEAYLQDQDTNSAESTNSILISAYQDALEKLIDYRVFKTTATTINPKSVIEFAKSSKNSRAIYEQELPHEIDSESSETGFEPDINFEKLMRKVFEKNFNNLDRLNKLGIELVHHKLTSFAVRVFERVYQLVVYDDSKEPQLV